MKNAEIVLNAPANTSDDVVFEATFGKELTDVQVEDLFAQIDAEIAIAEVLEESEERITTIEQARRFYLRMCNAIHAGNELVVRHSLPPTP